MATMLSDERAIELLEQAEKEVAKELAEKDGFGKASAAFGSLTTLAQILDGDLGERAMKASIKAAMSMLERSLEMKIREEVKEDMVAGQTLDEAFEPKEPQ